MTVELDRGRIAAHGAHRETSAHDRQGSPSAARVDAPPTRLETTAAPLTFDRFVAIARDLGVVVVAVFVVLAYFGGWG